MNLTNIFDPCKPIMVKENESRVDKYLQLERQWMPEKGYSENAILKKLRGKALAFINKEAKSFGSEYDATIPYVALNYYDRFMSKNQLPNLNNRVSDDLDLVAVSCLTLASKMRKTSFSLNKFLEKLDMDPASVAEMEIHIMKGLGWRLCSVTALAFLDGFLENLKEINSEQRKSIMKHIIKAQDDICFTEIKPSTIAAEAILAYSQFHELEIRSTCEIFFRDIIDKEHAMVCNSSFKEMCVDGIDSTDSKIEDKESFDLLQCFQAVFDVMKPTWVVNETEKNGDKENELNFYTHWKVTNNIINSPEVRQSSIASDEKVDGEVGAVVLKKPCSLMIESGFLPHRPLHTSENDNRSYAKQCLAVEREWMVKRSYGDDENLQKMRSTAVKFINERCSMLEKDDPFSAYLAVNYYDRFLDTFSGDKMPPADDQSFIRGSCLLLALKMRNHYFSVKEFMVNWEPQACDTNGEQRLRKFEITILETLKWKMRPVTAFCYVGSFLKKAKLESLVTKENIEKIILNTQWDIVFTKFRPSTIAAAAILVGCCSIQEGGEKVEKAKNCILSTKECEDLDSCYEAMTTMWEEKK